MHTISPALGTTEREASRWADLSAGWRPIGHRDVWVVLPASEEAVVGLSDPKPDLKRRMSAWGYVMGAADLADVALFAAGLARSEAEAWATGRSHVATRAYEDRRFLLGDRLLHWAFPWLDAIGREFPVKRLEAWSTRDWLLDLGDEYRPAPALTGTEGLVAPGYDGYGPLDLVPLHRLVPSVWSGEVITTTFLAELGGGLQGRPARATLTSAYGAAAERWRRLADERPGSAQLWRDLARRAERTMERLAG